jgi:hypothetical protein
MNPIENILDVLEQAIRKHHPLPSSLKDLEKILLNEWMKIDVSVIRNLIMSIPKRIQAVLISKGDPMRY